MYRKFTNDYATKANRYAAHKIEGTLQLAYNEFGNIFSKYVKEGNRALDFGCGTGRSTRYLKNIGFETDGVDIDPNMIENSKNQDQDGNYKLIEDNKIPQRDCYYDLVFSTLVLLEIPSLEKMQNAFDDIYRIIKFNGTFVVLTVNDDFYLHDWVSVDTNYPENKNLKSGDKAKVKIKEINLELNDYYWLNEDYKKVAERSGFTIVEELLPKARDKNTHWISENKFAPYVIFVMKKTASLTPTHKKVSELNLQKLSGKGFFKEIERSSESIMTDQGSRNKFSSAILLMEPHNKWKFHKSKSEEKFEHVEGKDITLHLINEKGIYDKKFIGIENDSAVREYVVPAETWFAEEFDGEYGYSLVKVTTCPGFDSNDVEEANDETLMNLVKCNPEALSVVERLAGIQEIKCA